MSYTNNDTSSDSDAEIFKRLRQLKKENEGKLNLHQLAILMIGACIAEGLDTRRRIVGALCSLELNRGNVVIQLNAGEGNDPNRSSWTKDLEGHYHLFSILEGVEIA